MQKIRTRRIQNTALFFMLIAPFTVAFYASYVFNPVHAGNFWLYLLLLLADGIAIINLGSLWLTVILDLIQPEYNKRELKYSKEWILKYILSVDILIPVAKEPIEIIKKTVSNAVEMDYPHQVYVLDEGDSPEVRELAKDLKIHYIARPLHAKGFAKAGNLNYGLKQCHGEFFAVFDADHAPKKTFLLELLPFFENKMVCLVQSPQHYINTNNFIASGTSNSQEIFYKYIQPAKNSYNASFCVGTNMLFRRSAIDKIGGIAQRDDSEDIWTTILLHEEGYESVFYNKVLAEGRAPETISTYFRQQNRWARGGFSLFFTKNPLFLQNLTIDQKIQYFFSSIHYFTAFTLLVYLLMPIIYLLFGLYPMDVTKSFEWPIHYLPYFFTVYFLPLFLLGKFKISAVSTAISSFSPYLEAFFSIVLKNKYIWVATEIKKSGQSLILRYIWPHLLLIFLSLSAVLVGWYNVVDTTTTSINTFWALINAYLLFVFIKNGLFLG